VIIHIRARNEIKTIDSQARGRDIYLYDIVPGQQGSNKAGNQRCS
jgi:hypothetical protein